MRLSLAEFHPRSPQHEGLLRQALRTGLNKTWARRKPEEADMGLLPVYTDSVSPAEHNLIGRADVFTER